jgi:transposase-like protein
MTKAVVVGGARRTRRSQGEWRSLVSRYQTSGLSIESFCRGEGISEASFYRWRTALSGHPDEVSGMPSGMGSAFVDLGALESVSAVKPKLDLRLELGDGLILHLVRH